jgi:hypothetical protein
MQQKYIYPPIGLLVLKMWLLLERLVLARKVQVSPSNLQTSQHRQLKENQFLQLDCLLI